MIERRERDAAEWDRFFTKGEPIDTAVALGAYLAVNRHRALNQSIVIWRDGGPVSVPADQIECGERPTDNTLD